MRRISLHISVQPSSTHPLTSTSFHSVHRSPVHSPSFDLGLWVRSTLLTLWAFVDKGSRLTSAIHTPSDFKKCMEIEVIITTVQMYAISNLLWLLSELVHRDNVTSEGVSLLRFTGLDLTPAIQITPVIALGNSAKCLNCVCVCVCEWVRVCVCTHWRIWFTFTYLLTLQGL